MFTLPRKQTAVLAALALACLTTAACSTSDEQPAASAAPGGVTELTVFAPQGANQNLQTATFTKVLGDKFKINFKFETTTYDAGPAAEKRQISLASGDYPDLYLLISWVDQFNRAELLKLSKQGVILPLNDLIAKYAPNIQKALEANPAYKTLATAPDGKIYGLPQWNDCFHCSYQGKFWINSAWLKKLGLSAPKTTEEMRAVLRAFKTKDPNGNGKADEIPLSSSTADMILPYFMNSFIYDPESSEATVPTLALNNGKVQFQPVQDKWREGLRYVASLYKEGLIDPGAFTQNRDGLKAKGDNADEVIVGAATMLHPAILVTLGQKDGRDEDYDAVPPLTGPDGVAYTSYRPASVPGASFVLTNKATEQDQIAAIKMLDYIFTDEGHLEGEFGKEGVGWQKPESGDVALNKDLKPLFEQIPADPDAPPINDAWGALTQYNSTRAFRESQVQPTDIYEPEGYERRLFEATKLYEGKEPKAQMFPFWSLWLGTDVAGETATLQTNINNYVTQANLEFVTGKRNIDSDEDWAAYLEGLNGLGLPRYLQIQQQAYDAL
ncbi:putative aldouronate transport system substrate-binding protein [Nonomuraea polychroma]|uniref:Putative aldouronate transport system substrate-binding protein n=1 Tax=Nonomuraea polychroma TaxID=46176 RepID=A0A438MAJ4_9ACTN|nr:extracellular solute-binding protein [Nonomuraea polychroma]RVX42726.1 putative aldouronate transport system substrate-binding protein [Nonomuraea polychroma]